MNWSRANTLIAGLAIIGTTNAIALGGAYYNRSGEPESTLRLTERELRPPYIWRGKGENSGLELQLQWRVLPDEGSYGESYRYLGNRGVFPAWLDAKKMAELGFDVERSARDAEQDRSSRYRRRLPRDAFIVLELDGPMYREMLDQASKQAEKMEMKNARGEGKKAAAEMMEWETRRSSRLFAVDAGLDRATLRSRFPDRAKYAIVHGQVRPMWSTQGKDAAGAIDTLTAEAVNVPFEMRDAFEGVAESSYTPSDKDDGHFEAVLAFGRRLEPWLMSVAKKQIGPPEASTR